MDEDSVSENTCHSPLPDNVLVGSKETERLKLGKAWYLVILMSMCYGVGELSHFLVGTTSRDMSQELEYGDQSCLRNNSVPAYLGGDNTTCSEYQDKEK